MDDSWIEGTGKDDGRVVHMHCLVYNRAHALREEDMGSVNAITHAAIVSEVELQESLAVDARTSMHDLWGATARARALPTAVA